MEKDSKQFILSRDGTRELGSPAFFLTSMESQIVRLVRDDPRRLRARVWPDKIRQAIEKRCQCVWQIHSFEAAVLVEDRESGHQQKWPVKKIVPILMKTITRLRKEYSQEKTKKDVDNYPRWYKQDGVFGDFRKDHVGESANNWRSCRPFVLPNGRQTVTTKVRFDPSNPNLIRFTDEFKVGGIKFVSTGVSLPVDDPAFLDAIERHSKAKDQKKVNIVVELPDFDF